MVSVPGNKPQPSTNMSGRFHVPLHENHIYANLPLTPLE